MGVKGVGEVGVGGGALCKMPWGDIGTITFLTNALGAAWNSCNV